MIYAVAAIGIAAIGAITTLAIKGWSAEKRCGLAQKSEAELIVRLEVAIANGKTETARADFQKRRADALDAAIVSAATTPIAGSFELLEARAAASAPRRDDTPAVRNEGNAGESTAPVGPDGLLPFGA